MRHGYFSDTQGNYVASMAQKARQAGAKDQCPFGHYTSLFAASPPTGPLPDKGVIGQIADARASGVDDPPRDEHGGIPAGYTYFGQLVVHDLTHSVAITARDGKPPILQNLSTPSLDLDTIYGGGPVRCPHLYQPPYMNEDPGTENSHQYLFYLGRTARAAFPRNWQQGQGLPLDLPRIDTGSRGIAPTVPSTSVTPLIYDDRNDDNLILGQLTAQFLLVHNTVANHLRRNGDPTNGNQRLGNKESFDLARHFLLKAYRRIIVHDYLQRLLDPEVYKDLLAKKIQSHDHLPIEFVFGAARVGHAMVRAAYTVNTRIDLEASRLGQLMAFSGHSPNPNLPLPADWAVDWRQLLEMEDDDNPGTFSKPQSARRISPFLAPTFVYGDISSRHTNLDGSLSFHDLWRCYQFGVPTGQDCATQAPGIPSIRILTAEDMQPAPVFARLHPAGDLAKALDSNLQFREKTPLSYYLLQEAALFGRNGRYLGPLGSHIYAKTILFALQDAGANYSPPAGQSGLTFDEIVNPSGIVTLPQLLKVPQLTDVDLVKVISATLQ